MKFCIVIFIMFFVNLGDGGYWEQIRSMTKPYKGRTILGKEMLNKLKNNLKRKEELPKSKGLREGPLKSLYLQTGYRYFPHGGRTGDREREKDGAKDNRRRAPLIMPLQYRRGGEIDGDMEHRRRAPLIMPLQYRRGGEIDGAKDHRPRAPLITPLQYRRGGGRTRTPMRQPGDPDPPIWTPTVATEAPITTTTSCSKKRTKFDYKAHFDNRAWGRTNASTLPRTPKRTKYRHFTPDIVGTGEGQWKFMDYTNNEWRVMPIWEEGFTPTEHYLELPTNVPDPDYGDIYDIDLVVNFTNYSLVTNATEPPETPATQPANVTAANVTAANVTAATVTAANVTAPNVTAPNATTLNVTSTIVSTPSLTTKKCSLVVLNVPVEKNPKDGITIFNFDFNMRAAQNAAESATVDVATTESTTTESITTAKDATAEDATTESATTESATTESTTTESTTTKSTTTTTPPPYATIPKGGVIPVNGTISDGYITYIYCLEELQKSTTRDDELPEDAKQALMDIWKTTPTKKTHSRTTTPPQTRGANETSAEKVSYLSTIKTRSTPFHRFEWQATWYSVYKDFIHDHDKRRVQRLSADLMKDAIHKIQQVTTIKDECMYATAFEVGYIIGVIREKYRRMMATYTEIMDRVRSRTRMLSANNDFHMIRPYHVLIYYEWLHMLEKDIDYLLEALEAIPFEEIGATEATISFRAKARDEVEAREIMSNKAQEKLKSQYRQEFLMRRLGLPRNMSTARRRFYNKWPVEDTWDHTPQYWMDGENRRGSL